MTVQDYEAALEIAGAEYDAKCAPIDAAYIVASTTAAAVYGAIDNAYWAVHGQVTADYETKLASLSATYVASLNANYVATAAIARAK